MTRAKQAAYYAAHVALCATLLALLVPFGEWPLRVPFDYRGDGVIHAALVKGVAEEGPWHLTRIGAPFGSDIADWPMGMWLPLAVTSALVRLTGSAGAALNLYWLISIVASGVACAWSSRRLGLGPPFAFVCGLLYAFLPYVFYRNTSHFGTMDPLVPLVSLLALRVAGTTPEAIDTRERVVTLGACFAQGLSYVYYAFFGCVLLAVAGALAALRTRRLALPRLAATGVLLLALGSAVPLVPSFAYWRAHGRNDHLSYKTVADADTYGLKLRQLLTPIADHPIGVFRAVAARIDEARFPLENENTTARLGLVGSLGFVGLLGYTLARAAGAVGPDPQLGPAATLTLAALLVAQVGGLGSLFSVFVSPDIRGYNRIVVFIAFFSLHASVVGLARGLDRFQASTILRGALLALLSAFAVLDQVPRRYLAAVRAETGPSFAEDEAFVSLVESRLPAGAMVFQLPHATIPLDQTSEPPMALYDPGRAFVSSRTLRWSWGSVIGRGGEWQAETSRMSPAAMARRLALAGFSGIWLDRWGYPAAAPVPSPALEASLAAATGSIPAVSSGGRYSFVTLSDLRGRLERALGEDGLAAGRREALRTDVLFPRWREGCSDEAGELRQPSRSCGNRAWAILKNEDSHERRFVLQGRLRAPRSGRLRLGIGDESDERPLDARPVVYQRPIVIPAEHRLRIELSFEGECETHASGPPQSATACVEIGDLKAVGVGS